MGLEELPPQLGSTKVTSNEEQSTEEQEVKINAPFSKENVKIVMRTVGGPIINLSAVYFLEYCCTVSFAERAHPKSTTDQSTEFIVKNAYVLLALSYQVGVFISRSSLACFKIRQVWIMTALQTVNWVIFFTIAHSKWLSIYYQIPLMIWVGLMGGCSYVNCTYCILASKELPKSLKELAVNIASFFVSVGLVGSAVFAIIVSNFIILD